MQRGHAHSQGEELGVGGPKEQAGILGWAGEGGELGLPSRAPDNLLSFQGPGTGGDTGVDGWGLAPAHS